MNSFFLQFHFLREKMFFFLGSLCITCGISLDANGQIPRWYWRTPSLWYCNIGASRSFAFGEKEAWSWQQTQTVLHWSSDCAFWAKQEPPKLTGCSLTTGEGNWDDGTHVFPGFAASRMSAYLLCGTAHTSCISCVHACLYWWFELKAPRDLVHSNMPESILLLLCDFPRGRQWAQNEVLSCLLCSLVACLLPTVPLSCPVRCGVTGKV